MFQISLWYRIQKISRQFPTFQFPTTTNPYQLSRSYSKERLSETSTIRCRFLAREGDARGKRTTSSGIKSKLSLKPESLKERETGTRERLRWRDKGANTKEKREKTTGWLAVLADQISRMARAPLNRFYFRSCSQKSRPNLTRRETFNEYLHELQER